MDMCMIFQLNIKVINVNDILDIQKYLIKKQNIIELLDLLKKCLLNYYVLVDH